MIAKFVKRTLCATLACACVVGTSVSLSACSVSDTHIVIGVQQTTGSNYQSMKNLLNALSEELDFSYEIVLVSTDADATLTTYQNALLSGSAGIISMVDLDAATTKTIIKYCEGFGAYYAGYMTDFSNVFSNTNSTDAANVEYILNSSAMLGAVTDGDTVNDGGERGRLLFEAVIADGIRKVTFAQSPAYAYPVAQVAVEKFKELAKAWNECHPNDQITWYDNTVTGSLNGVYVMNFSDTKVPASLVTEWANNGVEAVVAMNSLGSKLLTNVQTYGNGMTIYQVGYEDETVAAFPDIIKTLAKTPAETIIYPLIQILNAAHGYSYTDEPENKADTVITGNYLFITSEEEYEQLWETNMNFSYSHSAEYSIISVDDVKELLAENGGTFAKLKSTIASWTAENILKRFKGTT